MKSLLLLSLFLNLIFCSTSKKPNQWSDDSIPPPTTPTNTPSFPSIHLSLQTWPTDPISWPPTMSPYPTIAPHIVTTGSSNKKSLSKIVMITITVLSAVFVVVIVFAIIMIVRRVKLYKLSQYNGILNALSESELAKTE